MRKQLAIILAAAGILCGCQQKKTCTEQAFQYNVDKFYDLEILRYDVPEFDSLSLQQKQLVYCLSEAALWGRDILFDQNGRYNLRIRRTLENLYNNYPYDKKGEEFAAFERYLKRVWFSNGIHHHYSEDKFLPEFSEEWFIDACGEAGIVYDEEIIPARIFHYPADTEYNVVTPTRPGYTPDRKTVTGVLTHDTEVIVRFARNPYRLTIRYETVDGSPVAPAYEHDYFADEEYSVPSPLVPDYRTARNVVTGRMGSRDQVITVIYISDTENTADDPKPGVPREELLSIDDYETPMDLDMVSMQIGINAE